ncbi:unnamed protein product [Allacma fusca]|uniref:ZZ-type domain-containing protein n=1 Tax=Allacma fusca TaxID=39272 RepID=A0A8J2NYW3_9HEXA|nr:unnamed protein product [Allacma fusca]
MGITRGIKSYIGGGEYEGTNSTSESPSNLHLEHTWSTPKCTHRFDLGMVSTNTGASGMSLPTNSSVDSEELSLLVSELQELGYDAIRFASYRTAAKLRFIQTRSKFILIDIFNVIEAIREHGLNAMDPYAILTVPKIESVVTSLYVNLNKRLPFGQQVDVTSCARYLLSWMLIAYDNDGCGRGLRVFQIKVFLSTLCSGKLLDKLRYVFSQISDENGNLVLGRFSEYLQEVLALPAMVLEAPTFGYTEGLASSIFTFSEGTTSINVNCFLDAILDPGPPCICWLTVLHSMAAISSLNHGIKCSICQVNNIQGFRYKCTQCPNFNMCQNCYWQGKSAGNHLATHEVKEYSTTKTGGKSFRNSFRKSLRCVPDKSKKMPKFPEQERPLNLAHIVPPSPLPSHNGFPMYDPLDAYSDQKMFVMELGQGPPNKTGSCYSDSVSESDEEHRLIARYTARLASENKYPPAPTYKHSRTMSQTSMSFYDTTQTQREMIAQLEARNREIMREIARLRAQQEMEYMSGEPTGPILMEELQALRYHKSELEEKLTNLQDSRQHLMGQLEGLMKLLKAQQITPKSTPTSSPRSTKSPPMSIYTHPGSSSVPLTVHRSAPATPHHSETFTSLTGELRSAYSTENDFSSAHIVTSGSYLNNSGSRSLRNDLLLAADSVTNAMSTLVKELNSGSDEENNEEGQLMKSLEFEASDEDIKRAALWQKEMDQRYQEDANYLAELRARRLSGENGCQAASFDRDVATHLFEKAGARPPQVNVDEDAFEELYDDFNPDDICPRLSGFPTDDESYVRTDDEDSYIKTDDEGGGTDWEDGLKRWINR